MIDILIKNPLLLLFLVAAVGYPLGRIKIAGTSLGVAAVLFVGLAAGALHPDLKLPDIVYTLGLVLFVYTIGLASGSVFFASFRRKGLRDNLLVFGMLALAALLIGIASHVFGIRGSYASGMFAGSLTNTPALAGVLDYIKGVASPSSQDQLLAEPVIAYSLTYPVGVIGMILAINLFQRLWKVDYALEARHLHGLLAANEPLQNRTIYVTHMEYTGTPIRELILKYQWNVIFGRRRHEGQLQLTTGPSILAVGDLVNLIGTQADLDEVGSALGEPTEERLEQDLSKYDKRRFFVSNPQVAGRQLRSLRLLEQYGAIVTRIRRGDIELLPHGNTILAPGDQVRVVAEYNCMDDLAALFGDSYKAISEVDVLTFSLGLALGLLLGLVPIPLPGGVRITLGIAGGPLLVALVLGSLGRTGSLVWTLPYSANLTLRQVGLVLFLAGVGTRSGYAFVSTLLQGNGFQLLGIGAAITFGTAFGTLWVGYRLLKIPMGQLTGILAGLQTQPAILGFALEQAQNELPNIGYATVYPVATITKIILAQLLLALFF